MKKLFTIIALIVLLTFSSYVAFRKTQSQLEVESSSYTPEGMENTSFSARPEPLWFDTKEELRGAVIEANEAVRSSTRASEQTKRTPQQIEEITNYIDFKNVVPEVELFKISLLPVYITLDYREKGNVGDGSERLTISWDRGAYGDNYNHIQTARTRLTTNPVDINYGENVIIKEEVYRENVHICNQYFWVENGYNIHLVVPIWLLELYPEETFFEIQKIYT